MKKARRKCKKHLFDPETSKQLIQMLRSEDSEVFEAAKTIIKHSKTRKHYCCEWHEHSRTTWYVSFVRTYTRDYFC